jgi:ABC-2 type transport system permease protein
MIGRIVGAIMLNLLKHEIQSRLGAIVGWGIGLALFGAMYTSIFPEVADEMAALADLSIYQAMGIELGSFEGYIGSTVVLFIPIILGVYAIITSTQTLAGEEDGGTLELVLAMPMHRWQIVSTKAIGVGVACFFALVIAGIGNALVLNVIKASTEVDITPLQLFVAVLNGWPITLAFLMMGLFLGAYLPSRRIAALVLTVVFIASYFGENMAGLVESLDPIKPLSLFTYFDSSETVFSEGVQASDVLILLGVAAVFFALALLSFQRRNVTVGAWPWQRARISE